MHVKNDDNANYIYIYIMQYYFEICNGFHCYFLVVKVANGSSLRVGVRMGQTLAVSRQYHRRYASSDVDDVLTNKLRQRQKLSQSCSFPDLKLLPPEIGLKILSNVSAQELRVCRQVWQDLASDDLLWKR